MPLTGPGHAVQNHDGLLLDHRVLPPGGENRFEAVAFAIPARPGRPAVTKTGEAKRHGGRRAGDGRPELTIEPGLAMEAHATCTHAQYIEFKRQVAREFLAICSLRHDICRNLIRVWVQAQGEAGRLTKTWAAADLQQYEARIAALERLVGHWSSSL